MSDSGFSNLPPGGGQRFDPAAVPARTEQTVRIDSISSSLRDIRRPTRVAGEVTAIARDGTATIRTPRGEEIVVKPRGRANLEQGQKVELELPPGNPPRQAIIRPQPAPPQTPAQQTPPPQNIDPAATRPAPPAQAVPPPQAMETNTPPRIAQDGAVLPPLSPPPARLALPPLIRAVLDNILPATPQIPVVTVTPPPATPPLTPEQIFRLIPLPVATQGDGLRPLPEPRAASPLPAAMSRLPFTPLPATLPVDERGLLTAPSADITSPARIPAMLPNDLLSVVQKDDPLAILAGAMRPAPIASISAMPISAAARIPPAVYLGARFAPLLSGALSPSAPLLFITPGPDDILPRFDARIAALTPGESITLLPPATADAAAAHPPPGAGITATGTPATLTAQVVGATPQHVPVLSIFWPGAETGRPFLINAPADSLPPGTWLDLLPTGSLPGVAASGGPPVATATPGVPSPFQILSGWSWPAFDDALDIMATQLALPGTGAVPMARIMPNPANPGQMNAALLFFVAAVRAGDIAGWMGEKSLNALRRDALRGPENLARLNRDFAGLSRMLSEPVSQDWRALSVPMMWQNDIQKINIYYRHQDNDNDEKNDNPGDRSTRFIFDLNLDRMGDVQIDGLMKGPRLDVILRTERLFSPSAQYAMREKYLGVLDAGNLKGDLSFQIRKDHWVTVDARQSNLKTMI